MKIEKVNIDDLISPSYNPRNITPEEMEKLKTSIKEFGYVEPIIVNKHNNHIVGGNQRFNVLKDLQKELKIDKIEVVFIDEKDINREKALNIALNKIQGEFDFNKLGLIFNEMAMCDFDMNTTGFDDFEINLLIEHFDDDFEDIEDNEDYDDNDYFVPSEMHEEVGTFKLKENDVYNFENFEIKINDEFIRNRTQITIYQDTLNVKLECFDDENLLEDFLETNPELKERFRSKLRKKED